MDDWFAAQLALSGKIGKQKEGVLVESRVTHEGWRFAGDPRDEDDFFSIMRLDRDISDIFYTYKRARVCNRIALGERT